MIIVRIVLVLLGIALALLGAGMLVYHVRIWPVGIELIIIGTVCIIGVAFERMRYRATSQSTGDGWVATGERFVDPTTGVLTEVYYNAQTGERSYRAVK